MSECEEEELAEELKKLCHPNGKEKCPKVSANILHRLGLLYRRKTPDRLSLLQSIALMTSATVREPDNTEEIKENLDEVCSHVFRLAGVNSFYRLLDDIVSDLKQEVRSIRHETEKRLGAIKEISHNTKGEVTIEELESRKIQEINDLQAYITDKYTKLMNYSCEYCVNVMGNPPCKYSLVGLGSLARKEVTPYSDFESIIVLEEGVQLTDDYPHVLEYFRWLATIFQMILIRLGETVLRFMAIPCLNDSLNLEKNWFYDAYTPCGVRPDGFAPAASKNPLGRQTPTFTKPWTTELIMPISEMVKYLDIEEDLKNGYHLADILMKTCFVAGKKEIYENFEKSSLNKRTFQLSNQKTKQKALGRILKQLQEDFSWYDKLMHNWSNSDFLDIKRFFYRGSTLFVSALSSLYGLKECSCQEILEKLVILKILSANDCHKLKVCVTVACEFRLRFYAHCKSQNDFILQRYYVQHGVLDHSLQSIGITTVVSSIANAMFLRERLRSVKQIVPKKFHLPSGVPWMGAYVCVLLNLYNVGISECLKNFPEKNGVKTCWKSFNGFFTYITCLSGTGKHLKATQMMKKYLSKSRSSMSLEELLFLYNQLGRSLLVRRKFKSALKYFRKVNSLTFFHTCVYNDVFRKHLLLSVSNCYFGMERFTKALRFIYKGLQNVGRLTDILECPVMYSLLTNCFECLVRLGKLSEAENVMTRIMECRKMVTEESAFAIKANLCSYVIAERMFKDGRLRNALEKCENAWKQDLNKSTNEVRYLNIKSRCLIGQHRYQEAYSCYQVLLLRLRNLRRSREIYVNLDLHHVTVECLRELSRCAFVLKHISEALKHCTEALLELQQKRCKSASEPSTRQDLLYRFVYCFDLLANSGTWSETSRTKMEEAIQNETFWAIRSLFSLGCRHMVKEDFIKAVNHFQMALDALPTASADVALKRRRKNAQKITRQNSGQFVTDHYRSFMCDGLYKLGRYHEAFVQYRQAWREASMLAGGTESGNHRKLLAIANLVRVPSIVRRETERLRANEFAVEFALAIGRNHFDSSVINVLRAHLLTCLEFFPNCSIVGHAYTPSVYYLAMRQIPTFEDNPEICKEKWFIIRETLFHNAKQTILRQQDEQDKKSFSQSF